MCATTQNYFFFLLYFFVETKFHHVGQAGLELLISGDPSLPRPLKVLGLQVWDTASGCKFLIETNFKFQLEVSENKDVTFSPKLMDPLNSVVLRP